MKKRLIISLLLLLMSLSLVSCVKSNVEMTVDKTGKVSVSATYMYAEDIAGMISEDPFTDVAKRLEALGFTVEKYAEEGFSGIRMSLNNVHIDSLSSEEETKLDLFSFFSADEDVGDPVFFNVKKGLFTNTYTSVLYYDLTGSEDLTEEDIEQMMAYLQDSFEISCQVTLPKKALSHNADVADGSTYTWSASPGKKNEIGFSFTLPNYRRLLVLTAAFLAILIVVILSLILMIVTKNRREQEKAAALRLESERELIPADTEEEPEEAIEEDEAEITADPDEEEAEAAEEPEDEDAPEEPEEEAEEDAEEPDPGREV